MSLLLLVDLPQVIGKLETAALEWELGPKLAYFFGLIALVVFSGDINGSVFIYFQF